MLFELNYLLDYYTDSCKLNMYLCQAVIEFNAIIIFGPFLSQVSFDVCDPICEIRLIAGKRNCSHRLFLSAKPIFVN